MPQVVGISFRRAAKSYFFDPGELTLRMGDFVIVETARGIEFGEVVLEPHEVAESDLVAPLKNIIRIATGADVERETANREREKEGMEICLGKIAKLNLPMKLLSAEYAFDGSQITFYFSAESRVDFRELVKDVASALKTRVQLHQIGVRDEAKLIGGYGTCGRSLCCATFLSGFEPVSMKMAKDQSLFLNPAKFSGVCGKLMCCLKYEHEFYKDMKNRMPSVGAVIDTDSGRGKIVDVNYLSETLTLEIDDGLTLQIPVSQLDLKGCCRKHGHGCSMKEPNCKPLGQENNADIRVSMSEVQDEVRSCPQDE